MFVRPLVSPDGKILQPMRAGVGLLANFIPTNFNTETDETLTVAQLAGGAFFQGVTLTSDVTWTLPTGTLIIGAFPTMDLGDAYSFLVQNNQAGAFDIVVAVGADMTAIGTNNSLSVPPQASRIFTLVRTGTITFDLY